jgi:hypothetical protein
LIHNQDPRRYDDGHDEIVRAEVEEIADGAAEGDVGLPLPMKWKLVMMLDRS